MEKREIIIPQSERFIMEKLWEESPRTIMQLFRVLEKEQGWSKSTVGTLLTRMVEKGIIYYEEGGRARQYYPAVQKEDAAVAETESLIRRVYQGSASLMISTLIRKNAISSKDREELYRILQKGK